MRHAMIDLETLGSTPGCAILSIGAIAFDPDTNELDHPFYRNVGLDSCLEHGLKVEGDTFYWWMTQSEAARKQLLEDRVTLGMALENLSQWLERINPSFIWSHGASFDIAVLTSAYKAVNWAKPWPFRKERDTRTLFYLAGYTPAKAELAHHALEDSKAQALAVMEAMRKMKAPA